MKKINYLLMAILSLTFVLGSCTIEKRLYNKGYNIQHVQNYSTTKSKSDKDDFKATEEVNKTAENLAQEVQVEQTEPIVKSEKKGTKVEPVETTKSTEKTAYTNDVASTNEEMPSVTSSFYKRSVERTIHESNTGDNVSSPINLDNIQSQEVVTGRGGGSGGTNKVLLVILCLFWILNLLAVYLHDGSITLNFWITLLLDLTFVGGIIFSILVVLDVVDLS